MEQLLESLFTGPIASKVPAWAATTVLIMLALKYTGSLERMAKMINSIIVFVKDREKFDSEQERWAAEREAEIEEIHANAAVQEQAARQLADQRAQDRLHHILDKSLAYMQTDLSTKINELTASNVKLVSEISDMKAVAARAKESLVISHNRMDNLSSIIGQITANFDELKPCLISLSDSSKGMRTTVKELEAAIRLLVEVIDKGE